MFESIVIVPNTARNHPINVGDLAEKMLYYKNVVVFVGKEELITLFKYFDLDTLIEYLKLGYIKINTKKKHYGVGLQGGSYLADFMYNTKYDLKEILYDAYFEFSQDKEKSLNAANLLYKYVGIFDLPPRFSEEINLDLSDPNFMKQAIAKNIQYYSPHDPINENEISFIVEPQADGRLIIESNIDTGKYTFLNNESVILNIATAIEDLKIAANYSSEISVPELNSRIISTKLNSLIARAIKSANDIDVFQYSEFPDAPSLQEVINGKHRNTREFLEILEKDAKFKNWLTDLGDQNKLIQAYTSKVNEKTWMQKLPSKAGRFYLTQSVSTILKATGTLTGIAAGVVLSATNTFFAEKLLKGWKPNHFIENEIAPFLTAANQK